MMVQQYVHDFFAFGFKQALACNFAVALFAIMLITHPLSDLTGIPRYDLIFLGAISYQLILVILKIETWKEVGVIALFHLIGLGLELFKTHPAILSWTYPEPSILRIGTVPLYSGFMYAAVGSYVLMIWKLLKLRFLHTPAIISAGILASLAYLNFFTKHFTYDFRWWLIGAVLVVFLQTRVYYTPHKHTYSMPLVVSFGLVAFFIWIAENVATLLGAWSYPNQTMTWHIVHPNKISSWFLLFLIVFLLIFTLKKKLHTFR